MRCPKCGGKTWSVNCITRKTDNVVRRIRECQQCGYRFTTYESDEQPKTKKALRTIQKISDIVRDFE